MLSQLVSQCEELQRLGGTAFLSLVRSRVVVAAVGFFAAFARNDSWRRRERRVRKRLREARIDTLQTRAEFADELRAEDAKRVNDALEEVDGVLELLHTTHTYTHVSRLTNSLTD